MSLPRLGRSADGLWRTWFTPTVSEEVTVTFAIDGRLVNQTSLRIAAPAAGIYPYFLNTSLTLAGAQLTAQQLLSTAPVFRGAVVLLYSGEPSILRIPVVDNAEHG
jgi:hypothetical protein